MALASKRTWIINQEGRNVTLEKDVLLRDRALKRLGMKRIYFGTTWATYCWVATSYSWNRKLRMTPCRLGQLLLLSFVWWNSVPSHNPSSVWLFYLLSFGECLLYFYVFVIFVSFGENFPNGLNQSPLWLHGSQLLIPFSPFEYSYSIKMLTKNVTIFLCIVEKSRNFQTRSLCPSL